MALRDRYKFGPPEAPSTATKDELKKAREVLVGKLKEQQNLAREIAKHPEKERLDQKRRFFLKLDDGRYEIIPRHGSREIKLDEVERLKAKDINDVIKVLGDLIKDVQQLDPEIDEALKKVAKRKKSTKTGASKEETDEIKTTGHDRPKSGV